MLYLIPQFPVPNRYPEDWIRWLPEELKLVGLKTVMIEGNEIPKKFEYNQINKFTDTIGSSVYELQQLDKLLRINFKPGDGVFFSDVDFPGFNSIACSLIRTLYPQVKLYGFIHATSINEKDFWEPVRFSKIKVEQGSFSLFDKLFVSTNYHKNKLELSFSGELKDKLYVVGCPFFPDELNSKFKRPWKYREWDVYLPSRRDSQKSISLGEGFSSLKVKFSGDSEFSDRDLYYKSLGDSRIYLSVAKEETFGYALLEAITMGCLPVVPDAFSYPEMVPLGFRYRNESEMFKMVKSILNLSEAEVSDFRFRLLPYVEKWEDSFYRIGKTIKEDLV